MRVTRGWEERTFEKTDRADKETETITNVWDWGKGVERILSRVLKNSLKFDC